jgi:cytochrome c
MRPIWLAAGVIAGTLVALHARAQDGAALATSKGCTNCHALDQRKIGPSFKDIATKYTGNANAQQTIISELKDGKGHSKIAGPDADLKTVVDYVLPDCPRDKAEFLQREVWPVGFRGSP